MSKISEPIIPFPRSKQEIQDLPNIFNNNVNDTQQTLSKAGSLHKMLPLDATIDSASSAVKDGATDQAPDVMFKFMAKVQKIFNLMREEVWGEFEKRGSLKVQFKNMQAEVDHHSERLA